jgi:CBS domain containing-hemolysin-like protein
MNSFCFPFLAFAPLADAIADHWDSPIIILGKLAVIFGLVVLNAFFVASEFAIVKVRSSQLDALEDEGNVRAVFAKHVRGHLDAYLSATQLGITLASLALGWIGEQFLAHLL